MTLRHRRVATACAAMIGAIALMALVLHATTSPAAALASRPVNAYRALKTEGAGCGEGIIGFDVWITCTAMITGRHGAAALPVGDTILVMGGSRDYSPTSTVHAYATVSDTWAELAAMPTARTGLASAAVDDLVYAIGGWTTVFISPTAIVEAYDSGSDSWAAAASLPAPRGNLGAAAVGGKVYAIGGSDSYNSVTDTVTAYDPISDTWEYCSPMPTPRGSLAVVALGDLIYAIGGTDGTSPTARLEIYDTASDTWSVGADMPISRTALAAAAVDGKIYVIGGSAGGLYPPSYLDDNYEYDPATDTWSQVASMPTPRSELVAVAVGRWVYAIGGSSEANTSEAVNEVYLPPASHFAFLPAVLRAFSP